MTTNRTALGSVVFIVFISLFFSSVTIAQTKKASKVKLTNFDVMRFNQQINPDAQLLVGNVRFLHEDVVMYCDSAYFYQQGNSLDAYGNVHIIKADSLHIYSEQLFYSGEEKLARFRKQVRTLNVKSTEVLTTDSLDYDRLNNIGYYFNGGKLVDSANVLTSSYGEYIPNQNLATFIHKVHLNNPNFDLYNDTLYYDTQNKVATIHGPSNIYTSDTTHIYAEKGYYNTLTRYSELQKNAAVYSKEHTIKADTLQYNELMKDMHAFRNVYLKDTVNHLIIESQKGYFNQNTNYARASDSALCKEFSTRDTFYIHADNLEAFGQDSTNRMIFAYHHTRFYRFDVQGKCDSMVVIAKDSVVKMYQAPMLWSGESQLLGDSIFMYAVNGVFDRIEIIDNALAISHLMKDYYNQIKGNKITGYIVKNALNKLKVDGSVQIIYYPLEDSIPIGMNTAQSSYLTAYYVNGKMDHTVMTPQSNGTVWPLLWPDAPAPYLVGFIWGDWIRPTSPQDLFRIPIKPKNDDDL